jgi:hypothetical protein
VTAVVHGVRFCEETYLQFVHDLCSFASDSRKSYVNEEIDRCARTLLACVIQILLGNGRPVRYFIKCMRREESRSSLALFVWLTILALEISRLS